MEKSGGHVELREGAALEDALLAALRPRGVRERLRLRLAGGWTARQLVARLPAEARAALGAEPEEAVATALAALARSGRVRRRPVRLRVLLEGKGEREVLVDRWLPGRRR